MNVKTLMGALLLAALSSTPAHAHAGARVQLYVASARLEPQPAGWLIQVSLRDLDSGGPESGFSVRVRGARPGGSFGPVSLTDDGGGRYRAELPVADGSWSLTVAAEEIPGGRAALPSTRTWNSVTLHHGEPIDLAAPPAATPQTSHTNHYLVALGVAAGLAGVGRLIRARATASRRCTRRSCPKVDQSVSSSGPHTEHDPQTTGTHWRSGSGTLADPGARTGQGA
jgi:hypothetical protein